MYAYLLVAVGSMIGGVARFWMSGFLALLVGETFPWGTVIVNILGCLAIGLFATVTGTEGRFYVPGVWRQFFMMGVCGGFTTFSSFSLQTLNLVLGGEFLAAGLNVVASVVLCLAAVWAGHALALWINALEGLSS